MRWGRTCYLWEEMCSDSWGLREAGEKEGRVSWSSTPVQWWESGPGRERGWTRVLLPPVLATWRLTGYQGNHTSTLTRAGLSKTGSHPPVLTKVIFFEMLFLSW